jgi:type II secretory pathway predicted ATPase ExeA
MPKNDGRLKRLIEGMRDGNGTLSVVFTGYPELKSNLDTRVSYRWTE